MKVPAFIHRFIAAAARRILDYAGLTFCPAILGPLTSMGIITAAQAGQKFQVTLMGINYGQAFTLTEDPATAPAVPVQL